MFIDIYIFFFKNKFSNSLECKYNELQFGVTISFIDVSKQRLHVAYVALCLQQRYPSETTYFLLSEGVPSNSKVSIGAYAAFL